MDRLGETSTGDSYALTETMSAEEVSSLKDRLRDNPELRAKVSVYIACKLAREEVETFQPTSIDSVWRDFHRENFPIRVANIAILSNEDLYEVIELPDSEWLLEGVPPQLCAQALSAVEQGQLTPPLLASGGYGG